jgi:hypothetical protein
MNTTMQTTVANVPTGYIALNQTMTFIVWLKGLEEASRRTYVQWANDDDRAAYYENQPDRWVNYYANGYTSDAAVDEDLTYTD